MRAARLGLGAVGVLVGAYGLLLLWQRQRPDQLEAVATWWIGGVVLHDVVLAGAVLVVGALLVRWVPRAARAPVAVGAVVLGSVTLAAVPVLLAHGRRADNPTLLDRHYWWGWVALAALVVLAVLIASLVRSRRARPGVAPEG